jgi:hypothetical protein
MCCRYDPIEQAHVGKAGKGMGRKADADQTVPLCRFHHRILHHIGTQSFEQRYGVDLDALAAETERRWQEGEP